jgi:hypothetical protein
LFSEQFDNAAWVKGAGGTGLAPVVTANTTISPDGFQNADTISFDSGAGSTFTDDSFVLQNVTLISGATTFSFYAKVNSGTAKILARIGFGSYSAINITSNWQRFVITDTTGGGALFVQFGIRRGTLEPINATATIQIWGAQIEAGSYATSYIPTTTAAVTRLKDNCDKTGVSSLIGQTEGTVFVEFKMKGQSLSEDVYSNNKNLTGSISIQTTVSGQLLGFICYAGTFIQFASSTGVIQIGQTYKVAIGYKTGNSAIYLNGAQIAASSTAFAFTTTLDEIDIANNGVFFAHLNNKEVSQVLQFKTRLTNAQLAELTAL